MTDEAMVEAVARALCREGGNDPDEFYADIQHRPALGAPLWTHYDADARAAIRVLVPLVIERCAETAYKVPGIDGEGTYESGALNAQWGIVAAIRALIP